VNKTQAPYWLVLMVFFAFGHAIAAIFWPPALPEQMPPPVMARIEPVGETWERIRAFVDRRMDERRHELQPTDAEMEAAMNAAMLGHDPRSMSADKGAGFGWFAGAIAAAVWKAIKLAVAALLLAALVSLIWSHWYYLAAGAAAVAAWIEWRARSAAARFQSKAGGRNE
jgi:hypothetical protein